MSAYTPFDKKEYYKNYYQEHKEEMKDYQKQYTQDLHLGKIPYNPRGLRKQVLLCGMTHLKSVPYKVTARWLFYRLVQDGILQKTKKHRDLLTDALSKARHSFRYGYSPDILADTGINYYWKGEYYADFIFKLDVNEERENYYQIWFEADAMLGQFEYLTSRYRISLVPFGGQPSIPLKWDIAKKLESIYSELKKPIKILYFGDCDESGSIIRKVAERDVLNWCIAKEQIEIIPCGLTEKQAKKFSLPTNPEKPDQYQWEALNDKEAEQIIFDALKSHTDIREIPEHVLLQEWNIRDNIVTKINRDSYALRKKKLDQEK